MNKRVAIVILNWNGESMMRQYLPGVVRFSADADIYIADNASTDNSVEMLRAEFPMCKLILFDCNWGFAEGYNKALKNIDAEYFILLNSDIEVTEGWLKPIVSYMDANPDVAACQPKIMSIHNRRCFEYAGACGGFVDKYGYPFCRGRIFDVVEEDNGQYDSVINVLWATGAALVIRKNDYESVGGLDARFFAHNEEIDLCWRLRIMGRRICCVPQSVVYHVGGGTLPKGNPRKTYLNFRNNLTMLYKCLPEKELKPVMRMRCLLDYVAAFQMLLKGNFCDFKAVIKARRDYKRWKTDFKADRDAIHKNSKCDIVTEQIPISILWQYYFKGRKKYSDLPLEIK